MENYWYRRINRVICRLEVFVIKVQTSTHVINTCSAGKVRVHESGAMACGMTLEFKTMDLATASTVAVDRCAMRAALCFYNRNYGRI